MLNALDDNQVIFRGTLIDKQEHIEHNDGPCILETQRRSHAVCPPNLFEGFGLKMHVPQSGDLAANHCAKRSMRRVVHDKDTLVDENYMR